MLMVGQAGLVGPEDARQRQGDDGEIGLPPINLPGVVDHRKGSRILVEELLIGDRLLIGIPRDERLGDLAQRFPLVTVLQGLTDHLEAGEDEQQHRAREQQRPAGPAESLALQDIGREEEQRQQEHVPVIALRGDHREVDAGGNQQNEPKAVGEDEHGQAAHRPHRHHLEIVSLRECVVGEGAPADEEIGVKTDRKADEGDQGDHSAVDRAALHGQVGTVLGHLVGPPGADHEGDQGEVGEKHRAADFFRGDLASPCLTGIHHRRPAHELPGAPGHGVAVEEQIHRQRMPERAALHDEQAGHDEEHRV